MMQNVSIGLFLLQEATCLAKNMYYEARNQGTAGRLAYKSK